MLNVKGGKKEKQKKCKLVALCLGRIKVAYRPLYLVHQVICQMVHLQLVLIEVLLAVQCTKLKRKKVNKILSAS